MTRLCTLLVLAILLFQAGWGHALAAGGERCQHGMRIAGVMSCCCERSPGCVCKAAPGKEATPAPIAPRAEEAPLAAVVVRELSVEATPSQARLAKAGAAAAMPVPVPRVVLHCVFRI